MTPKAGLSAYGGATLSFFIFHASLEISGHIIDVSFPSELSIHFAKLPIDVRYENDYWLAFFVEFYLLCLFSGKLDVALRPLSLSMVAKVEIGIKFCFFFFCFSFTITVYSSTLWSYQAPAITTTIFSINDIEHDASPPVFSAVSYNNFTRRSVTDVPCFVDQLSNLLPTNPQFQLEVAASDDESDVKYYYSIGTFPGGRDVRNNVWMGGPRLVSSDSLPSGLPLYFSVSAKNSEGLETTAQCFIRTYDTTLPSGRLEQSFDVSSNPYLLSAFFVVHDDSPLNADWLASVGLGEGSANTVRWKKLSFVNNTSSNEEADDDLQHFSRPRMGFLSSTPVAEASTLGPLQCASFCLRQDALCISFDFDYSSGKCRIQSTIQGPNAQLEIFQSFYNFERIGVGQSAWLQFENLEMEHGSVYVINAQVSNVLGYTQRISSKGTLVDLTPPFTDAVVNARYNVTVASGCNASVVQRACAAVTPWPNHR